MPEIYQIILIALVSTFVILVLEKTELRQYFINYFYSNKIKILAKSLECDFCLGFWIAVVFSILFTAIFDNTNWILTPIFSSPITRFLI